MKIEFAIATHAEHDQLVQLDRHVTPEVIARKIATSQNSEVAERREEASLGHNKTMFERRSATSEFSAPLFKQPLPSQGSLPRNAVCCQKVRTMLY